MLGLVAGLSIKLRRTLRRTIIKLATMRISPTRGYFAIGVFVVVLILFILIRNYFNKQAVSDSRGYSVGNIYRYTPTGKGTGEGLSYVYMVNGVRFRANRHYTRITLRGAEHYINKNFPVIYDRSAPSLSYILILPEDFWEFRLPYPDSLNWTRGYAEY